MTGQGQDMSNLGADRQRRTGASVLAACMLASAALAACSTSTPVPEQMARSTVETAPADLQLLCADAAAKAAGGGNVLPVTSRRIDAATYQVDLNVAGSTRSCIIDAEGNVLSVQLDAT